MRLLRFTRNLVPYYAIVAVVSSSVAVVSSSVAVALSGIAGAFVIGKAADTVVHAVRSGRGGRGGVCASTVSSGELGLRADADPTAGSVCDNARDDAAFLRCRE